MRTAVPSAVVQLICAAGLAHLCRHLPPMYRFIVAVVYFSAYAYWAGYRDGLRHRPDPSPEALAPEADQALGRLATRLPDPDPTYDYLDQPPR